MRLLDNPLRLRHLTMDFLWGLIKVRQVLRFPWKFKWHGFIAEAPPPPPPPPPSPEELDIMRHREITSKAVSAILMLTLQWFKVSRALYNAEPAPTATNSSSYRCHEIPSFRAAAT
jgi:Domain of unknown function (DUF3402)